MNFWQRISRPIIGLAPMDGVTDASFRHITAKHGGPDVILTEFVNVHSAIFAPEALLRDFAYSEIERPVVAQVYGREPELFYKIAHIVGELGFDGLDINMGCPARKVAAAGCGAALIRTPRLARDVIQAARRGLQDWYDGQTLEDLKIRPSAIAAFKALNRLRTGGDALVVRRRLPISVKTRIGYERVCVEDWIPTLLEECPAAITLHGRTLAQGYSGEANWDAIGRAAEIARPAPTLLLGNGDLRRPDDIRRRVRESAVDGVLIGRGAEGNPWIFAAKDRIKQTLAMLGDPPLPPPAVALIERINVLLEHSRHYESRPWFRCFDGMRRHLIYYTRDLAVPGLRARLVRADSAADVAAALAESFADLEADASDSAPAMAPAEITCPRASL